MSVYAVRKDGFEGDIRLGLKTAPRGITASTISLPRDKEMVRLGMKTNLAQTGEPVPLTIEGRAKIGDDEIAREAVAAEDRMQAFLWRHLVPAQALMGLVYNPSNEPPPRRVAPPVTDEDKAEAASKEPTPKAKFTKRQVAGRLRQLKRLYEEWLLTDEFYRAKVAECEASL